MNELLQELFAAQVFVPAMHFVSKPVSKLLLSLSVCVSGVCLVKERETHLFQPCPSVSDRISLIKF